MSLINIIIEPFLDFGFMRRALISCVMLSVSATPLGIFLLYRRMSLVGDALSHGIFPGIAIAYLLFGTSVIAMGIGGMIAGIIVILLSGYISRNTKLKEDASFSGLYLGSLALGVTIISIKGSYVDLNHFLFGNLLGIDRESIFLIASTCSLSIIVFTLIYRILLIETVDITFLKIHNKKHVIFVQTAFLALVVVNLVTGFQILGTLLTVGLLIIPATIAQFWSNKIHFILIISMLIAIFSSFLGLEISYYAINIQALENLPPGPMIIILLSIFFICSIFFGKHGGIFRKNTT